MNTLIWSSWWHPFLTVNCNSITAQVESWRPLWGEFSPQGSFDLFVCFFWHDCWPGKCPLVACCILLACQMSIMSTYYVYLACPLLASTRLHAFTFHLACWWTDGGGAFGFHCKQHKTSFKRFKRLWKDSWSIILVSHHLSSLSSYECYPGMQHHQPLWTLHISNYFSRQASSHGGGDRQIQ